MSFSVLKHRVLIDVQLHILYFAFVKQIAMNDARVIGRQMPPLSQKITDILGTPLE